jgi:hypothetical protein
MRSFSRRNSVLLIAFLLVSFTTSQAAFTLALKSEPKCFIIQQTDASDSEKHAAAELKLHLDAMTGGAFAILPDRAIESCALFDIRTNNSIIVGPGPAASKYFPDVDLKTYGPEEFIIRTTNHFVLLAGGRPRGTIYAVNRFLQDQLGVRWWTPWATNIPHHSTLKIPDLSIRSQPAFEYRGAYWFTGFDPLWKTRNGGNNESHIIPASLGGCVQYKGFCHTFYPLVPPDKYFAGHPEWYSLINGKRTHERAQLCLTNPKLRDFMVERVKEWLRQCPDCQIISVTQNDWDGHCECPDCKALDDAEGSHSGTMITFVNYIAEKIEPEFPNVAVDTFAYQYTRKPPKTVKPRKNVIVRLCSIECNFRKPLTDPSNASFAADIQKWSEIAPRLYIWDYVTDFSHYIHPHPDWFTLGPNARFFQANKVKGVFEEGAYAGYGAEMAEMRAWILCQLLWNPQQDDRKLIREFLDGYYGKASAKFIYEYLQLLHRESEDFYLACYLRKNPAPYLTFKTLARAEELWQQAERVAPANSDYSARIRIGHLPVRFAFLNDWQRLRLDCWEQNLSWPLNESRKAVADEFRKVCLGIPGKDWTHVGAMSERGLQVETFLKDFVTDPVLNVQTPALPRLKNPSPPADLPAASAKRSVDLQDNLAVLYKRGEFADILPDPKASDHRAVRMPGNHSEWAFRINGKDIMAKAPPKACKVYVIARVEKHPGTNTASVAFAAGVYDTERKDYPAQARIKLEDATQEYHAWPIGSFEPSATRDIFVSPASNPAVKAIWIDRVYLVPGS